MFNKIKTLTSNSLFKHMALSGLCKPVSMIISYIYVPFVLNYLGIEKYGIWSTLLAIVSWISFFDIGIGNGLRNKLTESLASNDGREKKLISSAYVFISVIMISVIIIFSLIAIFLDWKKIFGVVNIDEDLRFSVILCIFFVASNFILSICKNVLFAIQKASIVSVMELFVQLLNLIGILIVRNLIKSSLVIITIIYGLSMLSVNFVTNIILYTKNSNLRPSFKKFNFIEGKNLTTLGFKFFIIQICVLVLFTTDSLIISRLYGASNVTPYSTVNKIFTAIIGVFSAFLTPVWSDVTKAKIENNPSHLVKLLKRLCLLMIPFIIGIILLVFIFRPLMKFWLTKELEYSQTLIILGAAYCFLNIWCNTYSCFASGLELMKCSVITAIVQAVVNIPFSLFFAICLNMEAAGILCGTVVSMGIAAIVLPIAVIKNIKTMSKGISL